jgi:hypothetical protein
MDTVVITTPSTAMATATKLFKRFMRLIRNLFEKKELLAATPSASSGFATLTLPILGTSTE